jgi:hypothetical protein
MSVIRELIDDAFTQGFRAGEEAAYLNPKWKNWYVVRFLRYWRLTPWRVLLRRPYPRYY